MPLVTSQAKTFKMICYQHSFATFCSTYLFLPCLFVLHLLPGIIPFFINENHSPHGGKWSYDNQAAWLDIYPRCKDRSQSPIDIRLDKVTFNPGLQDKLYFYNYNDKLRFTLKNAHHTVKLNLIVPNANYSLNDKEYTKKVDAQFQVNQTSNRTTIDGEHHKRSALSNDNQQQQTEKKLSRRPEIPEWHDQNYTEGTKPTHSLRSFLKTNDGIPSVKLDWLDSGNNEFVLYDIHFHWAVSRNNGTEHAIDGHKGAMEMHLVHLKRNITRDQMAFTSDAVAVISVLIDSAKKSSAHFGPIVAALPRVNATDEPQVVEYSSLKTLLPTNLKHFYTYQGSLTTPPCLEVVNWIILRDRLTFSAKQMERFRELYAPKYAERLGFFTPEPSQRDLLMPNIRNLVPLNGRPIFSSFQAPGIQNPPPGFDAAIGYHQVSYILTCYVTLVTTYFVYKLI